MELKENSGLDINLRVISKQIGIGALHVTEVVMKKGTRYTGRDPR